MDGENSNWLSLLKWSLKQSDGFAPSDAKPMSDEDKAFLEKVMAEGIRDDPKRMKEILGELMDAIEARRTADEEYSIDNEPNKGVDKNNSSHRVDGSSTEERDEEEIVSLLEELQDLVEDLDLAQIFAKVGGPTWLLVLIDGGANGSSTKSTPSDVEVVVSGDGGGAVNSQHNPVTLRRPFGAAVRKAAAVCLGSIAQNNIKVQDTLFTQVTLVS
jgi:hypothetical protein